MSNVFCPSAPWHPPRASNAHTERKLRDSEHRNRVDYDIFLSLIGIVSKSIRIYRYPISNTTAYNKQNYINMWSEVHHLWRLIRYQIFIRQCPTDRTCVCMHNCSPYFVSAHSKHLLLLVRPQERFVVLFFLMLIRRVLFCYVNCVLHPFRLLSLVCMCLHPFCFVLVGCRRAGLPCPAFVASCPSGGAWAS